MSQVCLLDAGRLSSLLRDALSWNDHVSSLLVSATNGSILAYAYKNTTPLIKDIRTQSTTITTTYMMAAEDTLIFEAQDSGAVSVITLVADRVLLSITSPEQTRPRVLLNGTTEDHESLVTNGTSTHEEEHEEEHETENEQERIAREVRVALEEISQELAETLREDLATMRWPDDI